MKIKAEQIGGRMVVFVENPASEPIHHEVSDWSVMVAHCLSLGDDVTVQAVKGREPYLRPKHLCKAASAANSGSERSECS